MDKSRKILSVVGARPQFIKAAPVSRALSSNTHFHEVMVHTGQHYDREMSELFFDELDLAPPAYDLGINGGSQAEMVAGMLTKLERVMHAEAPDMVVVYGDTNSTLAGGLAAAKLAIPVCHIEAGLRSFNRKMPEEINRIVVDHLSALHLCPTRTAVTNLRKEGIMDGVHLVGDVMYDAAIHVGDRPATESGILDRLKLTEKRYQFATVHRAENTDDRDRLSEVIAYLRARAQDLPVVFPVHPRTRRAAERFDICLDGLITIQPVGYIDSTRLLQGAQAVYTDSGGLQKEAYFHRVPCVTLRSETEWVETIEAGWNRLWRVRDFKSRKDIPDYGDGNAALKVVESIECFAFDGQSA
jgi:UDP-GlcNAc3NAcA epimerase